MQKRTIEITWKIQIYCCNNKRGSNPQKAFQNWHINSIISPCPFETLDVHCKPVVREKYTMLHDPNVSKAVIYIVAALCNFSCSGLCVKRFARPVRAKQGVIRWNSTDFFVLWLTAHGPCSVARSVPIDPWFAAKRPICAAYCHTLHKCKLWIIIQLARNKTFRECLRTSN